MGVHWKSKQALRTQIGKACLAHQCGNQSPCVQAIMEEIICPSGEQIANGGFETGDFTGWTVTEDSGMIAVQKIGDYWSFIDAYEGTYYCGSKIIGDYGTIEQDLAKEVLVECFVASSVFEVHVLGGWSDSPPGGGTVTVEIVYTDDTKTTVSWEATEANQNTWQTINLKDYLESGKTVKKLIVKINPAHLSYAMVDGISCQV